MAKQIGVVSPLRLVKWCAQWQPMNNWSKVPHKLRGIYVLHKQEGGPRRTVRMTAKLQRGLRAGVNSFHQCYLAESLAPVNGFSG